MSTVKIDGENVSVEELAARGSKEVVALAGYIQELEACLADEVRAVRYEIGRESEATIQLQYDHSVFIE